MKESTRAEHLAWCKQRAMEYVNTNQFTDAAASMISDLGKHPDTAKSVSTAIMLAITVRDRKSATDFVQGFS